MFKSKTIVVMLILDASSLLSEKRVAKRAFWKGGQRSDGFGNDLL